MCLLQIECRFRLVLEWTSGASNVWADFLSRHDHFPTHLWPSSCPAPQRLRAYWRPRPTTTTTQARARKLHRRSHHHRPPEGLLPKPGSKQANCTAINHWLHYCQAVAVAPSTLRLLPVSRRLPSGNPKWSRPPARLPQAGMTSVSSTPTTTQTARCGSCLMACTSRANRSPPCSSATPRLSASQPTW